MVENRLLYAVEGAAYYSKRGVNRLLLPPNMAGICFSNFASIVTLLCIVIARLFSLHVLYIPDGIIEYGNLKRKRNIVGRLGLKCSTHVLVYDNFSKSVIKKYFDKEVVFSSFVSSKRDYSIEKNVTSIITARSPFYSIPEKEELVSSIGCVLEVEGPSSKDIIRICTTDEIYSALKNTSVKAVSIDEALESELLISPPTTALIEAASNGSLVSVIGFRGYEKEIFPCWPSKLESNGFLCAPSKNYVEYSISSSYCLYLYSLESLIKKIFKYFCYEK